MALAPDAPDISGIYSLYESGGPDILTVEELALVAPASPASESAFLENLAAKLDQTVLDKIASEVIEDYDDDEQSRKEWLEWEADGMKLLGISLDTVGGASFEGASRAIHPGLLEAIVQFQARAIAELWPPEGPAKSVVLGEVTPEKDEQAKRVADYLNYLYTEKMPGAYEHHDKMLFRVGFSGCAFKKIHYCPLTRGIVARFYPAGDIVVPYTAVDLESTPRITHVLKYTHADLRRLQKSGVFLDIDLGLPQDEATQTDQTLAEAVDSIEGKHETLHDEGTQRHVVLEQSVYLDLSGYEEDVPLPYLVSVEKETRKTLAIYRHWKQDDEDKRRRAYLVMYGFIPGFGFYYLGLLHFLGRLSEASSGSLRALLDAGHFANLPAGFRTRDARIKSLAPLAPGEWREVDATAEDLAKAFFKLPYAEPSQTLFNLLQYLDEVTRRVAGTTEDLVGDNTKNVPVGTTLARIEQGLKVQTAIQKRLHKAQGTELRLVAEMAAEHLPEPRYSYDVVGRSAQIFAQDFDGRIDVIPVSDPNIVTATQRFTIGQALIDMAKEAPDLFDRRAVYERMLETMRVQNPDELLPDKSAIERRGPVEENVAMTIAVPVKAYPDQDHAAHTLVHQQWYAGLDPDTQKRLQGAHIAHLAEHQAWAYVLQMQQAMGLTLPNNPLAGPSEAPLDPETEMAITHLAAESVQIMATRSPPPIDPATAEAAERAEGDEARLAADIRRKDMIAEADIARSDAQAIARMNRENARREVALISKYLSPEARGATGTPEGPL